MTVDFGGSGWGVGGAGVGNRAGTGAVAVVGGGGWWYMDGRDNVVGAVSTNRMYRDRVCQVGGGME